LQTFLLWFIEGATYLEDDDARWQFALLWKKNLGENGSGQDQDLNQKANI
jgi:hypothetical protein